MRVAKQYSFEAAHWLPYVEPEHKCRRLHGHSYKVQVVVTGWIKQNGMVLDFAEISDKVKPLVQALDHRCLNDLLDNPTAEHLAVWFWRQLADDLPIGEVTVWETADSSVSYFGEQEAEMHYRPI